MKKVYSYYSLDIFHLGHLIMIKKCREVAGENGELVVGILTDGAIMEKKPKPIISFEERFQIAKSIKYIDKVIPQTTYSPLQNVKKINPDILMESESHEKREIENMRNLMSNLGGEIIIVPYFMEQSSTNIKNLIKNSKE